MTVMTPLARNAAGLRRLGFPESAEGDGCPGTAPAGAVNPRPAGATNLRRLLLRLVDRGAGAGCSCQGRLCCRARARGAVLYRPLLVVAWSFGQAWLCCGNSHRQAP